MDNTNETQDAWVLARIAALERSNRRLGVGLALAFTTLVSLLIAGALLFATHPEGLTTALGGGATSVEELQVKRALRVVDDEGHDLIRLGRDTDARRGSGDTQAVIGLYAVARGGESQQIMRLAASRMGSAFALSSLDGESTSSLFAGDGGVSLELRRGAVTRTLSEQREGASVAAAPLPPAAAPPPVREPARETAGRQSEGDALAARAAGDGAASVDLTNPMLQAIGSGFLVSPTSVTDSSGGLRVRGRIVNATSLDQARAQFMLTVGKREVPFTVARIAAGNSAQFSVELPQSPSADVRAARMRWARSAVSYGEE